MKQAGWILAGLLCTPAVLLPQAKPQPPKTLRGILLEQLKTNHDAQDWFVPASLAVAGLTAEQASWKDASGNHSIGQLTNHLVFWNTRELDKMRRVKSAAFSGNNDETFNAFDSAKWDSTVKRLDAVMKELETFTQNATDAQLAEFASELAHIGSHNAYHTGQILYIRKMKGWWDEKKGVK